VVPCPSPEHKLPSVPLCQPLRTRAAFLFPFASSAPAQCAAGTVEPCRCSVSDPGDDASRAIWHGRCPKVTSSMLWAASFTLLPFARGRPSRGPRLLPVSAVSARADDVQPREHPSASAADILRLRTTTMLTRPLTSCHCWPGFSLRWPSHGKGTRDMPGAPTPHLRHSFPQRAYGVVDCTPLHARTVFRSLR
jgi:hypothetical protein